MKFAPRGKTYDRVSTRLRITSMIDVIFLLLIFFMTTTTLTIPESQLTPGLKIERGEGGAGADLQPQIVDARLIDGAPVYQIGERVARSKDALTSLLRDLPKEVGVFVRVSGDVSVEWATAAIQACRDAGFEKVNYVPAE